jgi:hypothetical protein
MKPETIKLHNIKEREKLLKGESGGGKKKISGH